MKIAILLVLAVIVWQIVWNARRARAAYANIRSSQDKSRANDEIMGRFGKLRERVGELETQYAASAPRDASLWDIVTYWKNESVKRLCQFDFASAHALMAHAVAQGERLIEDGKRATPTITGVEIRAFIESRRWGGQLQTAPQLF